MNVLIRVSQLTHKIINGIKTHRQLHLPVGIFLLSALIHLTQLGHPNSVVFDEVHFGKFVTAYCCTGENIFDIHPPHGKLLIAGVAKGLGYEAGQPFDHIGEAYTQHSPAVLRMVPALAGTLLPVIIFVLLLQLRASTTAALIGAALVLFDNAMVLQSRVIALDSLLLLAIFSSLVGFIQAIRATRKATGYYWMLASGGLAGLACGVKFTGLVAIGLPGVLMLVVTGQYFIQRHRAKQGNIQRDSQNKALASHSATLALSDDNAIFHNDTSAASVLTLRGLQGLVFLAGGVVIYLGGWFLHFLLLTQPGSGDVWLVATGNFFADTLALHQKMLAANHGLTASHPDASPWWTWPFMAKPLYYWEQGGQVLYFLGNPIVWWGTIVMFGVIFVNKGLIKITHLRLEPNNTRAGGYLWVPVVGYVIAFSPFVTIPRALFLYHYLTPLLFSIITVVLWLDYAGWTRKNAGFRQRLSVYLVMVLIVVSFVAMSALTYAMPIHLQQWGKTIFWWWF